MLAWTNYGIRNDDDDDGIIYFYFFQGQKLIGLLCRKIENRTRKPDGKVKDLKCFFLCMLINFYQKNQHFY